AAAMLEELVKYDDVAPSFLGKLAGMVAASGDEAAVNRTLAAMVAGDGRPTVRQLQVLEGLAQGLARHGGPLAKRLQEQSDLGERLTAFLRKTTELALADQADLAQRLAATRMLAHAPFAQSGPALAKLLTPQSAGELQMAAVQALAAMSDPHAAEVLLESWN